jgi:acetyltransferase-like isoleucine patch superfamily enzyme
MEDFNMKFKKIGEDVRVSELAVITRPELIELGNHIAIDMWVYISTQAKLGNYIHIAPSVTILGGAPALIIMEDFTNIGSGGRIVCATDDFTQGLISPVVPIEYRTVINKPVIFKKYSTLGVNCTVLPGVTLGEGSIVGANSLVTKDTEPWMIYGGSPARPLKKRDKTRILESALILENRK